MRRIYLKTPSGNNRIRYERDIRRNNTCSVCGVNLKGVSRRLKNISKSERRVNRKYGGSLCSKCAREEIIKRMEEKWKSDK